MFKISCECLYHVPISEQLTERTLICPPFQTFHEISQLKKTHGISFKIKKMIEIILFNS